MMDKLNDLNINLIISYLYLIEQDSIWLINKHYIDYKHRHYYYEFNKKYSVKYLVRKSFRKRLLSIVNTLKQLSLNLSGLNITNDHLLNLINVNTLNISKCNNITDVSMLGNITNLDLSYCNGITDIRALQNVKSLKVFGCLMIKNLNKHADLFFQIDQITRIIQKTSNSINQTKNIGIYSPLYLAGVIDYLASEIIDLASHSAENDKSIRINPKHILNVFDKDEEIKKVVKCSGLNFNDEKINDMFSLSIYHLLKKLHPNTEISTIAMKLMNVVIYDICVKIIFEASRLARYTRNGIIAWKQIQTALRLILPGELSEYSISEGTRAVTKICNHWIKN